MRKIARDSTNINILNLQRAGFTMIELIFSIVIVGLVILSIPLIVRQSNLNTLTAQNVIGYYNALTLMETIKSKPWDANNVADFVDSGEYYILNTGNATDCFVVTNPNAQNPNDNRILAKTGLSLSNKRRMCDPNNKSASGMGGSSLDSINSFDGYSAKVSNNGVDIFRLDVEVKYVSVDFANGVNNANNPDTIKNSRGAFDDVKEIQITLVRLVDGVAVQNDDGSEGEAIFRYYAANIGNDIPLVKDNMENNIRNP